MGRKKLFQDGYRICSKCDSEESDKHPFPPSGNQCKKCLQEYNTTYIRNKRGHKPRSEKMSPEERQANKKASHQKWRADNPEKAKAGDKRRKDKQYTENGDAIRQKNSDWQKNNLAWRRQYLRDWRARKKAEQEQTGQNG